MSKDIENGRKKAMQIFNSGSQLCTNTDELEGFVTMLATLSIKMIHGMKGEKFKSEFIQAANADKEKITPMRVN